MSPENETPFGLPPGRISIKSADEPKNDKLIVTAQYNPSQLEIKRTISWAKPAEANKKNQKKKQEPGIHLEFGGTEGRTMTLELLFDAYEQPTKKEDAGSKGTPGFFLPSITEQIATLETLASVRNLKPDAKEDLRRPHQCMVTWGDMFGTEGNGFVCVIDSLTTKYTMFDSKGTPLRATCTVSLKEANFLELPAKKGK
ncbi:MAG TPA: hypothetical protein VIV40_36325 [Kofleriaceae bacterium]